MKYTVTPTSYRTWVVENEEGNEYFVSFDGRLPNIEMDKSPDRFKCSCIANSLYRKNCVHIRAVKNYLLKGEKEFEW